jgi:hypothetical protein
MKLSAIDRDRLIRTTLGEASESESNLATSAVPHGAGTPKGCSTTKPPRTPTNGPRRSSTRRLAELQSTLTDPRPLVGRSPSARATSQKKDIFELESRLRT